MLSLSELEPGEWYMAFVCICGAKSILFLDLTNGKGTTVGEYEVTCPACGNPGHYPPEHYYHDPKAMSGTSRS